MIAKLRESPREIARRIREGIPPIPLFRREIVPTDGEVIVISSIGGR